MSNTLTYHSVTGSFYSNVDPIPGTPISTTPQIDQVGAYVKFSYRLPSGFSVLIDDFDPGDGNGPVGMSSVQFPDRVARLMNGQLCTIEIGDPEGVEIVSNTSILGLADQGITGLYVDVAFFNVTAAANEAGNLQNFAYLAPVDGTPICLTDPLLTKYQYGGTTPYIPNWQAPETVSVTPTGEAVMTATNLAALQAFLDLSTPADVTAAITSAVNGLVAGAPGALDTLKELADALGDDQNFATTVANQIAAKQFSLTATAVKTSVYTIAANELVPVDATSVAITVTLPTAPIDKTRVVVKKVDASANVVTVAAGGSDVFNKTGGSTVLTLLLQNQAIQLQYKASGTTWYVVSTDVPLGGLDTRYRTLGTDLIQPVLDVTGVTDIYTPLTAAIAALPSTGGLIELPSGTLFLNTALVITKPNVFIYGRGSTRTNLVLGSGCGTSEGIKFSAAGGRLEHFTITAATSQNYAAINFNAADCRVERVKVVGASNGVGAQRGIVGGVAATKLEAIHCKSDTIVAADNTYSAGAGFYILGDDTLLDSCVTVNCSGANNSAYYSQMAGIFLAGVTATSGRRIRVIGCQSSNNGGHGLYASACDALTIDGGSYHDNGSLASAAGGTGLTGTNFGRGITIGTALAVGVKIVNTYLFNNQEDGVIVGGSGAFGASDTLVTVHNAVICNNHSYSNNVGGFVGGHGIEANTWGSVILGNVCYGNHNGISISGVHNIVSGNRCYANTSTDVNQGAGIQTQFIAGTPITVASVTTTSGSNAITVSSGGFPNVVEEQAISGTGLTGLYVTKISGNTILMSGNASASGTVTATFTPLWSKNIITGNICTRNDNFGIRVLGTDVQQGLVITANMLGFNGIMERSGANYDLLVPATSHYGIYTENHAFSGSARLSISDPTPIRTNNITSSDTNGMVRSLTYGTSVSWNGESANYATLTVGDTVAFTINAPSTAYAGRRVTYRIVNNSGGTMGTITWASGFKLAGTFTNPASTRSRTISFIYDGTSWIETDRSAADI